MNEEMVEKIAQLQHENLKLLDELNHLKELTLNMEEVLNLKCSELSKEKNNIKSLQQQVDSISHMLKDKDHLIDSLEHEKKKFKDLHTKVSAENLLLKEDLLQEKLKNKQMETLKTKEEGLKCAYAKIKEENQKLVFELSLKSDECLSNAATVKDLLFQVKELQNEKAELMALRDTLLTQEKEERLKSSENLECFLRKGTEWPNSHIDQENSFTARSEHLTSFNKEVPQATLRQEILEVELQEKQEIIGQLESLLRKKEEEELARNESILELKKELFSAGLLNCDSKTDLRLELSAFYNIYNILLKLIQWPEGQSGECKPLADVAALSVIVKDGVQTTQPSSVRVIETISIASQTDPIKNLSPVLLFRTFENLQCNVDLSLKPPDSDEDEEESLPFDENDGMKKGFQLFSVPKNCDLDMDMYRSCRKLSVLPEEDIDESFNRKSSLKKPYSSVLHSCNSKTQSADDITKMKPFRSSLKSVSSWSNITPENGILRDASISFWEKSRSCDTNDGSALPCNSKRNNKKNDIGLQPSVKSQKDTFRQPHSLDSYLDPLKTRTSELSRQTSDPTQNTMAVSPFARRESYIRRPKSTCRPLTLPCDKSDKKKEERICKVRFDLPGMVPKTDENVAEINLKKSTAVLNGTKKIKRVSRFSVEIIDEVEFRKSLEENENKTTVTRKRPPLIHSVVYKKSVFKDVTNFDEKNETCDTQELNNFLKESPDSPVYDTAAEDSPVEIIEYAENEDLSDPYPLKKRRQSDVSCCSFEDSQSSSEGNDILIKSIKLHTNSECIIMKELKKRASDSSCSNPDSEIPYIDAEDLPVIKPSPDIVKLIPVCEILSKEKQPPPLVVLSPGSLSEGSDPYLTPCEGTPVLENNESSTFGSPKSTGLSKSPTVLKNLANFELLAAISESRRSMQSEIIEEEKGEDKVSESSDTEEIKASEIVIEGDTLKRTSSDASEASESDTLTYGTVKSHMAASSDCDSDTYVTVWSDRSFALERKFSDLSENSSSPYNTPPDTSSASFCTPPDTYSPVLNSIKRHSNSNNTYAENQKEEFSDNFNGGFDFLNSSPSFHHPRKVVIESNGFFNRSESERLRPTQHKTNANRSVIFDSPKLEFYETNDSVENLEAFLQTEEGLMEGEHKTDLKNEKPAEMENLAEPFVFETEEFREALSKRNSLESPKPLERRSKKHPPLSRQNSTDEYNFLDPHDSCLNLSEEISSPSTTPDTSNKTVIFKNVPLTVSNTIDLEDDFPISDTEILVNFNGSQTEILEIPPKEESVTRYTMDGHCLSEPCTPSISSADFLEFSVPRKQRSSFTEESLMLGKFETNLPEIIVSRLSSESENSVSEVLGCVETDFASNVSDRSEIHLSDVNSVSGHSDNSGSLSEHSENLISDVFSSDSEKSTGVSPEITQNSSSSTSDNVPPIEISIQNPTLEEHSQNGSVKPAVLSTASEMGVEIQGAGLETNQLESGEVSCVQDTP